ncbi:hypothetical protein EFK50_00830 [Nocardioides marmoriginsengisoli]|uniref:Class I SAM-dependent methyltransferase n=1 Tax=Nocardioides marmoriginsengisoli TaxID=661483 RepID=A0A3N0CTD3_9ACTN|nr:hypothetical protein [Nocardioides marmoriginsengisoli]RNL66203.1 hypothetical protein EFK50_00830 [Nocardioides marmoriginsengisoli]
MGVHIDSRGIRLTGSLDGIADVPLDLKFGGHRIWSFTPERDGHRLGPAILVTWPKPIASRLDGIAQVELVPHNGGSVVFEGAVKFGRSGDPLVLVDDLGNPLSLDKGGRLQRTFEDYAGDARAELISAAKRVLVDLRDACGLDAYLCYGGLLGAARSGAMIGHDSDLDLAFLSAYTHPFDIIQESRRAEKTMARLGWQVIRMSSANFKIWVPLPSGKRAGVDVFGSFHIGDTFNITGSLTGTLDRDAILPFGEIDLEGVSFPAPADVPRFLEFTYGPGWKVPDPAFHFGHPPANVRRMSHWFRGTRSRLPHWQEFYKGPHREVPSEPSLFARWAAERMEPKDRIIELGSGTGRDAIWFTQEGHGTVGSDYCGSARTAAKQATAKAGLKIRYRPINPESLHSVLTTATKFAHDPHPRHIYARGLIDALAPSGRIGLWRFCAIAGRRGGLTFLEFRTDAERGARKHFGKHARTFARPAAIVAEIERHGGRVVEQTTGRGLAPLGKENPVICRLVVSWTKEGVGR